MHTITSICLQLMEHKQKASLEAVAKVLEMAPSIVLSGKPKNNQLYSWIDLSAEKTSAKSKDEGDKPKKASKKAQSQSKTDSAEEVKPTIRDHAILEEWLSKPENKSTASPEFVFLLEKMSN